MQREERDADNGIKAGIICLLLSSLPPSLPSSSAEPGCC